MPTPAAEIHIDENLVRALLTQQRPDLAGLPVRIVASGWDNVIARAGEDQMPRLNESIDRFVAEGLKRGLPLTLVNHPHAPHAFDLMDDSET